MQIDFEKMQGLVPVIIEDFRTREVLMLGFMNSAAWERTLDLGYVTFYSRTRNQLWTKGETSGNRLKLIAASTDCDRDSLLIRVEVEGAGVVCHQGTRSCFTKRLALETDGSRCSSGPLKDPNSEPSDSLASAAGETRS
jgi:phosphoribosyl-AMP cyclohydrolase